MKRKTLSEKAQILNNHGWADAGCFYFGGAAKAVFTRAGQELTIVKLDHDFNHYISVTKAVVS